MAILGLKMRHVAPLVVFCVCAGTLCATTARAQESFEQGFPPAGWTFIGHPALGGVADNTSGIAPTNGSHYGWISTGCSTAAGTTCPDVATTTAPGYDSLGLGSGPGLGTPIVQSVLTSPTFTLASPLTISFDVNFITTDGTNGFADFALVQLVPSNASPINLFVANTTCATCAAVPPVGLNPGVATMTPPTASFAGTTATFGASSYGNVVKFGGGPGGPAGWIHITYPASAGDYKLVFYVTHVGDLTYPSALAIDNITPAPTPTTTVQTQPASGTAPVTYTFNGTTGQVVQQIVDLSQAALTGASVAGVSVEITNTPIRPADFPSLVAYTSFAVDKCFLMSGELDASHTAACKEYQILCTTTSNSTPSGANCPVSSARNEFYEAVFNPDPASTLPTYGSGLSLPPYMSNPTAVAYPMATDTWGGGPCIFPANDTNLANALCPQNFLTNFVSVGDPTYTTTTTTKNPNSTVIPTYNHPMQQTAVTVVGQNGAGWNNTSTVLVNFSTQAPFFGNPAPNNFVPAPIASVNYWLDQSATNTNAPPSLTPATTTPATVSCPTPSTTPPTPPTAALPPFLSTATLTGLSNGSHILGYFSTDCAGTEELQFSKSTGNWATTFFTKPINVDTVPPTIGTSFSPGSNPAILNSPAPTLNFTCSDQTPGSGLQTCDTVMNSLNVTLVPNSMPTVGPATFSGSKGPLSTSTPGASTITVYAKDVAGNATSKAVNYSVLYSTGPCLGEAGHQILQPINADGTSVWKQGRTIPVKFRVCDANGLSVGTAGVVASFKLTKVTAGTVTVVDETATAAAADTTFRWDPTAQQWIFNLSTSGQSAGYTYLYSINLNDGTAITFQYGLR